LGDGIDLARIEAAVMTNGCFRHGISGWNKLYVLEFEAEVVDGFLDEICVFFADLLELRSGHIDEKLDAFAMTEACRFQPSVVRVAVHLFFECVEDPDPRVRRSSS